MLSVLSVMGGLNNVDEKLGMSQSGDGHIHMQEVLASMLKTEVSIPMQSLCIHWSQESQHTARCSNVTSFPHDRHGYSGPGLVSMPVRRTVVMYRIDIGLTLRLSLLLHRKFHM